MNEPVPVRGVLVAHGRMADGLADAVRRISGLGSDESLVPITNDGASPGELFTRVEAAIGPGPAMIFTDLQSGSCAFAGRKLLVDREDIVVISGVNLPALLEFVLHRELPLDQLVPRILAKGRAALECTPADVGDHVGRAVSSG